MSHHHTVLFDGTALTDSVKAEAVRGGAMKKNTAGPSTEVSQAVHQCGGVMLFGVWFTSDRCQWCGGPVFANAIHGTDQLKRKLFGTGEAE